MPLTNEQNSPVRREARIPEATGRTLDAAVSDGQRVVAFTSWMLTALGLVREILGSVVANNEPVVPDPTEAILGDDPSKRVRVPML